MEYQRKKLEYHLTMARVNIDRSKTDPDFRLSHLNYAQFHLDEAERFFEFIFFKGTYYGKNKVRM